MRNQRLVRQAPWHGVAIGSLTPYAAGQTAAQTVLAAAQPDGHPDLRADEWPRDPTRSPPRKGGQLKRKTPHSRKVSPASRSAVPAGDRHGPPKGGDGSVGAAGNVGGYNTFWLDPGSSYTIVNGERRTSLVTDPPDGRVPPLTPAARQRVAGLAVRPTSDATQSNDPGLETAPGAYDDPERRPLGERCLLGFGSTSGPPALPNYFYNNLHKIVQTPIAVLIHNNGARRPHSYDERAAPPKTIR